MKLPKLQRSLGFSDGKKLDKAARTLELSFSSEYSVERWFGNEVLSHAPGAMDLTRLMDGAPLLFNHNPDAVIGVVESAHVGADKRGYAKVRFSNNDLASQVLTDIEDGILKNVSFGYRINEMVQVNETDFMATRYEVYEISIVSIPADPTVGVGRSDSSEELEVKVNTTTNSQEERGASMPEKIEIDVNKERADAVAMERSRIASINALGEKHEMKDLARSLIDSGKSIDEARAAFLEKIGVKAKPVKETDADVGLSEREVKEFSFVRALNALANPQDRNAWEAAAFEREVSEAAQKKSNRSAKGIMVPAEVLRHQYAQRDLVKGTVSAGGNLVPTELLAGSFIEILRKRSVLQRAGAQMLNGLKGDISIPRATGTATAYWVGEGVAVTESQQAFDQIRMTPKTVGSFVDYSRKLLLQSSIDVEAFIRQDIAAVLALEIDRVGLYGSGSASQPAGLNTLVGSGLNTVNFAGANPTFAEIVQMETEIAADDADVESMKYLVNARGRGALKTTEKASATGMYIWEPGNTVNGYATEVSNQINTVSGTDPDYWFGAWANLIFGMWSGLDLMVDPYAGATAGNVRVIGMQDVDVVVRRPEYFCKGANNP